MDLVITHNLLTTKGGAEKVILEIAKKFEPLAIYVLKYDPKNTYPEFSEFNVVEVGTVSKCIPFGLAGAYKYYNLKIRDDYDVVNPHWSPAHWVRNRNPRCVWYCLSPSRAVYDLYDYRMRSFSVPMKLGHYFYSKIYRRIDKRICSEMDYILAISDNVKARVSKYLGLDSEVLYPGVDYGRYVCADYKKYFFCPGRIDPTKRIEYVISAFNEFKKRNKGFELVIAGGFDPKFKGYYDYLKSIFDGKILVNLDSGKMAELYSNCYSVLFAGINEDFGLTPLEAMASFKPIISVNEGGPKETIVDGKTGYLVNNPLEMAGRMDFLSKHPDVVEKMGKAGRARVIKMFSWKQYLDRFRDVCREVSLR